MSTNWARWKLPSDYESSELARLCTMDLGKEVTANEVRTFFLIGTNALTRFNTEEVSDIVATLYKEIVDMRKP